MWIIGLLLLAAAVVVGIEIGISNDQQVDFEAFNQVWTSNPAVVFLVGVVTALVGAFGLWLMFSSMRRSRVRRRERRAEVAERDRLADERRREIDAMSPAERGDREDGAVDERTAAADHRDDRDREPVPAGRRDDDIDVRDDTRDGRDVRDDRRDDRDLRDERQDTGREAIDDEHEAEHHERRGGILHRS